MLPGVINPFYDENYPSSTINNPYGHPTDASQGNLVPGNMGSPIFAELLKSLGMNMTEGPQAPGGAQGAGGPMFTNYNQQTGVVNPRSQVPYDQPVTPETLKPYSTIQNMHQLAALSAQLHKAGVPPDVMQQIITAQTGGAIRDPGAERAKETKREFDLRQEEVRLKRSDVQGAQQARQDTAANAEQRRRDSAVSGEVNRLEAQREFITKYGGKMPDAQFQAELDSFNQRQKFISDMATSLGVNAAIPSPLEATQIPGMLWGSQGHYASPAAGQQAKAAQGAMPQAKAGQPRKATQPELYQIWSEAGGNAAKADALLQQRGLTK